MRPQFVVEWDPSTSEYLVTSRRCGGDCDLHGGDDAGTRIHVADVETVETFDRVLRVIGLAAARGYSIARMADVH